jgi:hypothetical protein
MMYWVEQAVRAVRVGIGPWRPARLEFLFRALRKGEVTAVNLVVTNLPGRQATELQSATRPWVGPDTQRSPLTGIRTIYIRLLGTVSSAHLLGEADSR